MKTFEQWFRSFFPTETVTDPEKIIAESTWSACAAEYRKELHYLKNELTAANLRAQVAERKLKDMAEEIRQRHNSEKANT